MLAESFPRASPRASPFLMKWSATEPGSGCTGQNSDTNSLIFSSPTTGLTDITYIRIASSKFFARSDVSPCESSSNNALRTASNCFVLPYFYRVNATCKIGSPLISESSMRLTSRIVSSKAGTYRCPLAGTRSNSARLWLDRHGPTPLWMIHGIMGTNGRPLVSAFSHIRAM
jgi:hypothetical protein